MEKEKYKIRSFDLKITLLIKKHKEELEFEFLIFFEELSLKKKYY
jgi:hypothetical protein